LLVIVTEPVRPPAAVGVNVTLTVQLAPVARLVPQLFVCAKSPLAAIELIDAAAVPVFCTVTDWLGLVWPATVVPNARLDGDAESDGPGAVPVPVRPALTGPFGSLVETVSVPLRDPLAFGEKVTLTVQLAPAARLVPQLFVCAKSPVTETEETVTLLVPSLLTVTARAVLVLPTVCAPKSIAVGVVEIPTGGGGEGVGHGPQ
jgi:antitoxin (DNA-binding transcriptional repressor) of toxin-antitoxin stability system